MLILRPSPCKAETSGAGFLLSSLETCFGVERMAQRSCETADATISRSHKHGAIIGRSH